MIRNTLELGKNVGKRIYTLDHRRFRALVNGSIAIVSLGAGCTSKNKIVSGALTSIGLAAGIKATGYWNEVEWMRIMQRNK